MSTETQKVDVLAVMEKSVKELRHWQRDHGQDLQTEAVLSGLRIALSAVAELIEAAKIVNADHAEPHDCYATGPNTGDAYLDFIRCPGCQLAAALTRVGSTA
jgi:hypothetical protein